MSLSRGRTDEIWLWDQIQYLHGVHVSVLEPEFLLWRVVVISVLLLNIVWWTFCSPWPVLNLKIVHNILYFFISFLGISYQLVQGLLAPDPCLLYFLIPGPPSQYLTSWDTYSGNWVSWGHTLMACQWTAWTFFINLLQEGTVLQMCGGWNGVLSKCVLLTWAQPCQGPQWWPRGMTKPSSGPTRSVFRNNWPMCAKSSNSSCLLPDDCNLNLTPYRDCPSTPFCLYKKTQAEFPGCVAVLHQSEHSLPHASFSVCMSVLSLVLSHPVRFPGSAEEDNAHGLTTSLVKLLLPFCAHLLRVLVRNGFNTVVLKQYR